MDNEEFVRICDKCPKDFSLHHALSEILHCAMSPWLFYQWGKDILGPFLLAFGKLKWIKSSIIPKITIEKDRRFYWQQIIC